MVEERPRRRRRKGRARARKAAPKKAPPKKAPLPEEEELPGLLKGEIPEEVVVVEEPPAVAEEEAISAEAVEEAVPPPEPEPTEGPEKPATVPGMLMSVPEFRQRVIRLAVRKLR